VELYEQIRREYEQGVGTIKGVAGSWACTGERCRHRIAGAREGQVDWYEAQSVSSASWTNSSSTCSIVSAETPGSRQRPLSRTGS
jgi:hypothetical protein